MKIQICSDLHLEFENNRNWLKQNPLIAKGDILIIAGDTYYLGRDYQKLDFLQQASKDFQSVYLIPGNHEYYDGFDASIAMETTFEKIFENVFLVNNYSIQHGDTKLIFSTMWSRIQRNLLQIKRGMADFKYVKFKGERLSIQHYNEIHTASFNFLYREIKTEGKKVVVTHHLPSELCNTKEFKGSVLNEAFCVDKTNFILDHEIDYWIYGHSHRNLKDFKIGDTKMITNQFGYIRWNEHLTFDYEKVIEL